MDNVDRMLARPLSEEEASRLETLETRVWSQVGERLSQRRVRLAVIAVALIVGGANGGLLSQTLDQQPSELGVFGASSSLWLTAGDYGQ